MSAIPPRSSLVVEPAPGVKLRLSAEERVLVGIYFHPDEPIGGETHPVLEEAARQLRAYFAGALYRFDLPLAPRGTPFQLRVWQAVESVPYGETRSYRDIAERIGSPKSVRAVGAANGANPLPLVIPCHRIVGAGGALTGFGGGLPLKRRLLELEARHAWSSRA
jgi:methylated-DNA-[protein]-cysteine S-methyltransferase